MNYQNDRTQQFTRVNNINSVMQAVALRCYAVLVAAGVSLVVRRRGEANTRVEQNKDGHQNVEHGHAFEFAFVFTHLAAFFKNLLLPLLLKLKVTE
jgi:hypothetical protein